MGTLIISAQSMAGVSIGMDDKLYCNTPDCPLHDECESSIKRLAGKRGKVRVASLGEVCRQYIGWIVRELEGWTNG